MPMVGRVAADADCNRCRATVLEAVAGAVRAPRLDFAPLTLASEALRREGFRRFGCFG